MSLLKKLIKIANITADEILDKKANKTHVKATPQAIKDEKILSKYNKSNKRIEEIRKSIQNTKQ